MLAALASVAATAQTAPDARLDAKQRLGKAIFADVNLSEPRGMSCATCHDPAKAFQGNAGSDNPALARGAPAGSLGDRNVPTIMYSKFSPRFAFRKKKDPETGKMELVPVGGQFWDGRALDLEEQAGGPLLNPREMANPSKRAVVDKIRDGSYAALAREVYGAKIFDEDADKAYAKLTAAVAAFERTEAFAPFSSKFDDVLRGKAQFSAQEAKGFALFKDPKKGNCLACHDGKEKSRNPRDWLFTDFTYDTLGAPRNATIPDNRDGARFDPGLCKRAGLEKFAPKGFDANSVCGAFKVPTLRNIAVTAPYMHNGAFGTLRDAVAFYFTRDTNPEKWYPRDAKGAAQKFDDLPEAWRGNANVKEVPYDRKPGETPRADDSEIDAIVAFLQTLTDRQFVATAAGK